MDDRQNYYLGKYWITFYRNDDETFFKGFNNLKEICEYKGLEVNSTNMNTLTISLYRALRRPTHNTRMLDRNGEEMHVYLIDLVSDDE